MRFSKLNLAICGAIMIFLSACGSLSPQPENTSNEQIQQMQATIDALEFQVASSGDDSAIVVTPIVVENTQTPIIPTAESLPTAPVPAGTPIMFDGWALTVSQELIINSYHDTWGITIYMRNLGDTKRVFRFVNSGVTAKDNLGNVYQPSNEGNVENCEAVYHEVKNLEITGNQSETIMSESLGYSRCDRTNGIHMFQGPIPLDASQLIIHFEEFGPYRGVDVVIDL